MNIVPQKWFKGRFLPWRKFFLQLLFLHSNSEDDDVCWVFDPENDDFVGELDEKHQTMPRHIKYFAWSFLLFLFNPEDFGFC